MAIDLAFPEKNLAVGCGQRKEIVNGLGSGKSGERWTAYDRNFGSATGSDVGLGLAKATGDAVCGGEEIQLQGD